MEVEMEPVAPEKRKRGKTGKFTSKRVKNSQGNAELFMPPEYDHSYISISDNVGLEVGAEVDVTTTMSDKMRGKRVVVLDLLAEGLKACSSCTSPLHLSNVNDVYGIGLAAILYVQSMIHAGVGEGQINSILTTLNIPPVSHSMLDDRQREVDIAVETVADKSVDQFLVQEASLDEDQNNSIEVSVDAGWQKRGSGKAYSSVSGHCTMIGTKTGEVVGYSVRPRHVGSARAKKVHKKLGMSPGTYIHKLAVRRDLQSLKKKAVAITRKAKQEIIRLKQNRLASTTCLENREGTPYATNIDFTGVENDETVSIPEIFRRPGVFFI